MDLRGLERLEPKRPLAVNVVFTPPLAGGPDTPSLAVTCSASKKNRPANGTSASAPELMSGS